MGNRAALRGVAGFIALGFASLLSFGDVSPRINTAEERPVILRMTPCQGDQDSGASGIVVADETVISVAHAVIESRNVFVRDTELGWWRAEVRHIDRDRDLAVVHVPGLRATDMPASTARQRDYVTMLAGLASGTVDGEIIRRVQINTNSIGSEVETKRRGYEVAMQIDRGDSGAGIVDGDGRLVGIVFAQSNHRSGVTWATDLSDVPDVLAGRVPLNDPCGDGRTVGRS